MSDQAGPSRPAAATPGVTRAYLAPASLGSQELLQTVMGVVRRRLGMELASIAEFRQDKLVFRAFDGDFESFGLFLDEDMPLASTYCAAVSVGELPNVIEDAANDPLVRDLPITAAYRVGSYLGIPIALADGTLFGSFFCVSHSPRHLDERDVRLAVELCEMVGPEVDAFHHRETEHSRISMLLDGDAPSMVLQPIFDLLDGHCIGVEALSRFPAGYGNPEQVFSAAHAVGLGLELERQALLRAFSLVPGLTPGQFLAVNITPKVAQELAARVVEHPEVFPSLVLEITEHAAIESYATLRKMLAPWRERGLRLAIDDAGAGYASLKHVVELQPDIIKIDRSLIDGCAADRARRSAIGAFVLLALDSGATVIAEGVELPADLEAIRDLGVDAAQGYLLARPTADRRKLQRWTAEPLAAFAAGSPDGLSSRRDRPEG